MFKIEKIYKDSKLVTDFIMRDLAVHLNSRYTKLSCYVSDEKLIHTPLPVRYSEIDFEGARIYKVGLGEENRMDLIAKKFYGDAEFFWVICYANVWPDPFYLPAGTRLLIPIKTTLSGASGVLGW